MSLEIRPVREEDVEVVCDLIHALARYERLESHCKSTPERLREELFGPHAVIGCVLAWERNESTCAERPVGFALYFYNFSTFLTRAASILRISSSLRTLGAADTVVHSSVTLRGRRWKKDAGASTGAYSTGTSLPSTFTRGSALR